eukprot:COSAG01_NODE_4714_length_4796_cov_6.907813_6_plen_81_part_00
MKTLLTVAMSALYAPLTRASIVSEIDVVPEVETEIETEIDIVSQLDIVFEMETETETQIDVGSEVETDRDRCRDRLRNGD